MEFTQVKGNLVELQCIMKFISMGFECSLPYGNQAKYDILVDIGTEILRVQCKKSHWVDDKGSIQFSATSSTTNTQKTTRHKYTNEQIDYFATCWEDNVYLIPVDECSTSKSLRIVEKTVNTPNNVNMAEDYLAEKILGHLALYKEEDFEEQIPVKIKELKEEPKNFCIDCGQPIYKKSTRCISCSIKNSRKVQNRPSREELKEMIRKDSFLSIGKKYGVTDNTIRKWCSTYNLPRLKNEIKNYTDKEWELI